MAFGKVGCPLTLKWNVWNSQLSWLLVLLTGMVRGSPRRLTGPVPSPGRQDPDPRSTIFTLMWPWARNLPARASVALSQTEFVIRISQVAVRFGGLLSACRVLGTVSGEEEVVRGMRWVFCCSPEIPQLLWKPPYILANSAQNQLKPLELPLSLRRVIRAGYLHPPHHPPAS